MSLYAKAKFFPYSLGLLKGNASILPDPVINNIGIDMAQSKDDFFKRNIGRLLLKRRSS
jgi:hypothetical protein